MEIEVVRAEAPVEKLKIEIDYKDAREILRSYTRNPNSNSLSGTLNKIINACREHF